jgi:transposase-like protein
MEKQLSTEYAAALALLRTGKATHAELARLLGCSRQLIRFWAKTAGIDAPRARDAYVAQAYTEAISVVRKLRKLHMEG